MKAPKFHFSIMDVGFLNNYKTKAHNNPYPYFQGFFDRYPWEKKEESIKKDYEDLEMDDKGSSIKDFNINDLILYSNHHSSFEIKDEDFFLKTRIDTNYQTIQPIKKDYEDLEIDDKESSIKHLNVNDIILDSNHHSSFEIKDEVFFLNKLIDTDYQTMQPIEPLPRKKLIFGLIKPGRKKKNESNINADPLTHTKYRDDDIIMKIKVKSWDHYEDHLNLMLELSDNDQINGIRLKKIDPSIIKVNSRKDNLALLQRKISDILSGKISKRFKNVEPLYNAKKIDLILQEGDPEIISALNKTFLDSIDLYCSKRTDIYLFEELQKLENDIEEFKNNGENEDYIQKYTEIAKNFKQKIKVIHKRQPRRKEK